MPASYKLRVTIQGKSDAEVIINTMEVQARDRQKPLRGTQLRSKTHCGGQGVANALLVDLDASPAKVKPYTDETVAIDAYTPAEEAKPIKFPYVVTKGDAEVFHVFVATTTCDCKWSIGVRWASEGRTGHHVVDQNVHGETLRTTATRNAPITCGRRDGDNDWNCFAE